MRSDPNRLVTIAGCGNAAEADMLKIALEGQGINAVVDGGDLSTALSYIGSAIGDVKVLVRQENAQRAKAIVIATRESYVAPDKAPWFCGKCMEEVEGGFEICWSCGEIRDEVESPFPATAVAVEQIYSPSVATENLGRVTDNPYESPSTSCGSAIGREDIESQFADGEKHAWRAVLAAAFSVFMPLLSLLFLAIAIRPIFIGRLRLSQTAKVWLGLTATLLFASHAFWLWMILFAKH